MSALFLIFGFSFLISSTSCVTCPAGQQSCGDHNERSSADAGDSGESETNCDYVKAIRSCMDAYCKTASNPFCTCYKRGFDLSTDGCKCVDFDTEKICTRADQEGLDPASYDCAAASSGVSSYCVPVD